MKGSSKLKNSKLFNFLPNQVHHEGHCGGEDHGVAGEEAEAGGRGVDWRQEDTWWKQAHNAGVDQSFLIVGRRCVYQEYLVSYFGNIKFLAIGCSAGAVFSW